MKKEVLDEVKKQAGRVLKVDTVRCVMEKYGVANYWTNFAEKFEDDRRELGDGSVYFRTLMRKLLKAATRSVAPETVEPVPETSQPKKACVQIALTKAIPASYMPNPFAAIKEGTLVAVHLTDARCAELGVTGFANFQPLIARVDRVLDSETFDCVWLKSVKKKDAGAHGTTDGYQGKWSVWSQLNNNDEEEIPKSVIKSSDIYAKHFQFMPDSQSMCGPLQAVLKKMLNIFTNSSL